MALSTFRSRPRHRLALLATLAVAFVFATAIPAFAVDDDNDTFDSSVDCDDTDPAIHPGATEVAGDGVDQDCDGQELCFFDADGDDFGGSSTIASGDLDCTDPAESDASTDCDDANPSVHPGGVEVTADEIDEDCDGQEVCFTDADDDGFGGVTTVASADLDCTDDFEAADTTDCNDADAGVHPGAVEACSDVADNDCDGDADCADADCAANPLCLPAFGAGSLIIPMDTDAGGQNNGMLRAYGLVYELLRKNVPVNWVIDPTKVANGTDFTISAGTLQNVKTGAVVAVPRTYRGGPFVVSDADAAAALRIVQAWQAVSGDQTVVHKLTSGSFDPHIARALVGAPRIAVLKDGNETIAFNNLNAAGIRDSTSGTWSNSSADLLTEADVKGPTTTNDADGVLFHSSSGLPRYCYLTSEHYNPTSDTPEVVQEVRSWLDSSPLVQAHMQCASVTVFENTAGGLYLTTAGLQDDGSPSSTPANRVPSAPLTQLDGTFDVDSGAVDSIGLQGGSFKSGVTTLINDNASVLTSHIVMLSGRLDGDNVNGRVTYLAGHDYSLDLPISSNPQTNGVRLFLNSVFESDCAIGAGQDDVLLTKSAPAITNTSAITFTISYTNPGPRPVENVVITDTIPAGTTFSSATGGGAHVAGVVTWHLPPIASGASGSVGLTVAVTIDGTYQNTATMDFSHLTVRTITSNTTSTVRDTVAPTVTVAGPPINPLVTADATPTLVFGYTESGPLTANCSVRLAGPPGSVVAAGACALGLPGDGSFTVPVGLVDGDYIFKASVADAAGNVGLDEFAFTIDTTAPIVVIPGPPSNPTGTSDPTPSFVFSVSAGGTPVVVQCQLFSVPGPIAVADVQPCSSPFTVPDPLVDGSYVFEVTAVDAAGNVGSDSSGFSFTVDTTAPDVTITGGPSGVTSDSTPTFTFTVSTGGSPATVECRFDADAYVPCVAQFTALVGLTDGPHTFTVQAADGTGNTASDSRLFSIDTTPPDTAIETAPSTVTNLAIGEFAFASEVGAVFECRIDTDPFAACPASFTTPALADGTHTFDVRAIDAAGNVDPTPAHHTWAVDTAPPDTLIETAPTDPSNDPTPTFAFVSEIGVTFECSIDANPFAACPAAFTTPALADGVHTFDVRAIDTAGNIDPTPAHHTWTVDTTPPDTTIETAPSNVTDLATGEFAFVSEVGATFQCRIDIASFAACTSPFTTPALADGTHTFDVRAIDAVGNVDPTPAQHNWVVDTVPPDTLIETAPTDPSNDPTPTFAFVSEIGVSFECSLDANPFAACSVPFTTPALADGVHAFDVRAIDTTGNVDPTPAHHIWAVDTVPPDTIIETAPTDPSNQAIGEFEFVSEAAAVFECRIDAGAFAACSAPFTTPALADGVHAFDVRAVDATGNADPTPAVHTWSVDTTPPAVTITGPASPTSSTPTFEISAGESVVTMECRVDADAYAPCGPTSFMTSPLTPGPHTVDVRVTDAAANSGSGAISFVVGGPTSPCSAGPRICKRSTVATLKLRKDGDAGRDKMTFIWSRGDATSTDELGDPALATQYAVCVWDYVDGAASLVMEMVATPGATCAGGPCWQSIRAGNAVRYKDPQRSSGGLKRLRVQPGAPGTSDVFVRARGSMLPDPPMPFRQDPRITVQVINSLGTCWGGDFVRPARVNTEQRLVATEKP